MFGMRRREFITLLGGVAAGWPLAARGERQGGRVRRVGVLQAAAENDQETQARTKAFRKELAALGWTEGGRTGPQRGVPAGAAKIDANDLERTLGELFLGASRVGHRRDLRSRFDHFQEKCDHRPDLPARVNP